ncbi:hypothetical protein BDV59DRAFT_131725 [Aspergillus ambiguus]|uniref:uncharacterized protein n=1 Tax=Aspergillus ambiguus TaxID=176160 RepID=UPI003CCE1FB8
MMYDGISDFLSSFFFFSFAFLSFLFVFPKSYRGITSLVARSPYSVHIEAGDFARTQTADTHNPITTR